MADEVSEIKISVDNRDALKGIQEITKAYDPLDQRAEKSAQVQIAISDKTRSAREKQLRAFERRYESVGVSPQEKLSRDYQRTLGDGGTEAERARLKVTTDRVTAHEKATQKAKEEAQAEAILEQMTSDLARETKRLNDEKQRQIELQQKAADAAKKEAAAQREVAKNIAEQAQRRVATPVGQLELDKQKALQQAGPGATHRQLQDITRDYDELIRRQKQLDLDTQNKKVAEGAKREQEKAKAIKDTTAALVEQARYRTATPTGRLDIDRQRALRQAAPGAAAGELAEINKHYDTLVKNQEKSDALARSNKLREQLNSTGEALGSIANKLAVVGAAAGAGVLWLVKTGAELERAQTAFRGLLGSKQAGDAFFQSLIEYSQKSAFSLNEIATASQRALALGFKPEAAKRVIQASFAVAAAMGQNAETADRVTLALGQMQAKQRVSAEEMNQLSEAGVRGWDALAQVAGKTVPEMMKLAEKGMLNANAAVEVLTESILRRFGKVEQEILNTTTFGKWQQLQKQLVQMAQDLRATLLPVANDLLSVAKDWLDVLARMARAFGDLSPQTKNATLNAVIFAGVLVGISKTVSVLIGLFKDLQRLKLFDLAQQGVSVLGQNLLGVESIALRLPAVFGIWTTTMVAAIFAANKQFDDWMAGMQGRVDDWERRQKGMPKKALPGMGEDWVSPSGKTFTAEEMAAAFRGSKAAAAAAAKPDDLSDLVGKYKLVGPKVKTAEELERERAKAQREYERQVEVGTRAMEKEEAELLPGIGKISLEYQKVFRDVAGNAKATALVRWSFETALANEIQKNNEAQRKMGRQRIEEWEKEKDQRIEFQNQVFAEQIKIEMELERQTINIQRETLKVQLENEVATAERSRSIRKADLDARRSQTEALMIGADPRRVLAMKIDFERQGAAIEIEAANEVHNRKMQLIRIEGQMKLDALRYEYEAIVKKTPEITANYKNRREALTRQIGMAGAEEARVTEDKIATVRLDTTKRTNDLIIEEYKRHYDKVYDAASGILDNLLSKSRSWGDVMKSIIKAAILTPIKEAAAHWIASVLTKKPQIPGQPQAAGAGGLQGLWERLRGSLGIGLAPVSVLTPPTFPAQKTIEKAAEVSAAGAKTAAAAAETTGKAVDTAVIAAQNARTAAQVSAAAATAMAGKCCHGGGSGGMAGQLIKYGLGTAGTASAGGEGGTGLPGGAPGAGGGGGLPSRLGGLRDLIGLGNPQGVWQGGGTIGKIATSDAAAIAGAGLIYSGLKRGGKLGVAMSTAGGALVGAKIGTMIAPGIGTLIGAAIGAAAGFVAGMIRTMIKSARQKMIEKVQSIYGVKISNQLADQFVQMAKDQYGGDINMAAYSPQVQELTKLYAMATGQSTGNFPRPMYGVTLTQSRGGVQLQPVYSNGAVVANPYTGTTTTQFNQSAQAVYVQLDPNQANALLEGRVVKVIDDNPQAVAKSQNAAMRSGTERNAARAALLEPLTTMA